MKESPLLIQTLHANWSEILKPRVWLYLSVQQRVDLTQQVGTSPLWRFSISLPLRSQSPRFKSKEAEAEAQSVVCLWSN